MIVLIKLIVFLAQKLLYYQISAKITKKFNGPYFLGVSDMVIKPLSCLILMWTFQNSPNELQSISGSEKITLSCFHAVSFVYKYLLK